MSDAAKGGGGPAGGSQSAPDPAEFARRMAEIGEQSRKLDDACHHVGRDPALVRRSVQHMWDGRDRGQLVDRIGRHLELGFTEQIINCQGPEHARVAEAAAEALPELRSAPVR